MVDVAGSQQGWPVQRAWAALLAMPDPGTFLEGLESLYRGPAAKPRMVLVSFLHNPTTACVEREFFERLIGLAARQGTMVVHDFG
jgi:alanine-synthesizing transaminase